MSDSIEELSKLYRKNVLDEHARRVGLFTIPEYPEFEAERGMLSSALDVILTTLRYLAPATLLTLFWGQQSFLFKLIKYIDSAFRSIFQSSDEQKEVVLQWINDSGTVRVEKLETVWRQGWILCGVLDIALPGSCHGHPPKKLSIEHAQSIAESYLGVEPMFTLQELEAIDSLAKHQEWKFITFLDNIRLALEKLKPSNTKANALKNSPEGSKFTFDYIARGSGLVAAQLNNKAYFKIYALAQQANEPGEIIVSINGPENSYGMIKIPPILGKAEQLRKELLKHTKTKFLHTKSENVLPITQGTTYFRSFGKTDISKTYYIPQKRCNIKMDTDKHQDYVKIGYTIELEGLYEISITSKNRHIPGSPFQMIGTNNIIEILEKDNFCLEDGEQIHLVEDNTNRKVVVRIVHFGNEKMILRENGTLEKISDDDEKKLLISKNMVNKINDPVDCTKETLLDLKPKTKRFYNVAKKVVFMCKVCKAFSRFNKITNDLSNVNLDSEILLRNQKHIPDVVNSTLNDNYINSDILEKRNRYVVPENISVSILTEKPDKISDFNSTNIPAMFRIYKKVVFKEENLPDNNIESNENLQNNKIKTDNIFENNVTLINAEESSNPFLTKLCNENSITDKKFSPFLMTEYETNNSQNEETETTLTKLVSEHQPDLTIQSTNPFSKIDDIESSMTTIDTETKNPFLTDDSSSLGDENLLTDFIIGAPVSIPHHIISPSEINISQDAPLKNNNISKLKSQTNNEILSTGKTSKIYYESVDKPPLLKKVSKDSLYNSNESIAATTRSSSISPKREMRDSAYVSIDDNAISSEIIHESLFDALDKQKIPILEKITDMVERGYWDNCPEIQETDDDEINYVTSKYDLKRTVFTPIKEENDKNVNIEEVLTHENDSVTSAFAELDNIYNDYFANSEKKSGLTDANNVIHTTGTNNILKIDSVDVDSASEVLADVKRQPESIEGKISEVQANIAESFSVSQDLHPYQYDKEYCDSQNKDLIRFGNKRTSNLVLEKKLYWDEKIRQIEAKSEELKSQLSKKRTHLKYARKNDSLTKRKGKKIVEHFLKSNEDNEKQANLTDIVTPIRSIESKDNVKNKPKIDWDSKYSIASEEFSTQAHKSQSIIEISPPYLKQELSEQVFRAFETSPKRFFGTSRQQILNKIDTFLSNPDVDDKCLNRRNIITHETGLVSSRISLFHDISKTEPLPWARKKSTPCHEVTVNNVNITPEEHSLVNNNSVTTEYSKIFSNTQTLEKSASNNITSLKKEQHNDNLRENRTNIAEGFNHIEFPKSGYEVKRNNDDTVKHLSINHLKTYKSKSELDIFNKVSNSEHDDLEKHKSCEELPRISVKNFISLFEDASKTSITTREINHKRIKMSSNVSKSGYQKKPQEKSSAEGTKTANIASKETLLRPTVINTTKSIINNKNKESESTNNFTDLEIITNQDQDHCLSDIELEIIETPDDSTDASKYNEGANYIDYKSRFKQAKQYFQSLEELRDVKKTKNISKTLLTITSQELPEKKGKSKKSNIRKSRSMPSSEISKYWNQMHDNKESLSDTKKLVKISEKFNVDDLFEDVMEGRLSRQGSLRGIPHKKAVLETFRSMESVSDKILNSYDLVLSHDSDLLSEPKNKNAQTYLSEYPYLPTTDPSKYHSRLDANASGLITFKELTRQNQMKPRRNSVPDMRINPLFSVDL